MSVFCIIAHMKKPLFISLIIVISVAAIGLGVMFANSIDPGHGNAPAVSGLLWPNPKQLQPFTMQDHRGNPFGLDELKGNWSFLFFGYTHCPDICPITLSIMNQAYETMHAENPGKNIQVIFVSVDPQRDTQEVLHGYVNYFNREFIGLGGTPEQMHSLTQQMGIPYFYAPADESGNYNVDHSASLFLLDERARLVGIFSGQHQRDDIANRFKLMSDFILQQG